MRIMTANIWGDYFGNPVSGREDNLTEVISTYSPDVIGFQEVRWTWNDSQAFAKLTADYNFIGTEKAYTGNNIPMAVKKNFVLIEKGYRQFVGTPDSSKGVTWAVLKDKTDGRVFAVCNTHFWWMTGRESDTVKELHHKYHGAIAYFTEEEHDGVRKDNAECLVRIMKRIKEEYSCPVFAFGDMNCTRAATVFTEAFAKSGVQHLFDVAPVRDNISSMHGDPKIGEGGKCHGEMTSLDYESSIDHIVALPGGFDLLEYRVVTDRVALDMSDHSPVFVDVNLI